MDNKDDKKVQQTSSSEDPYFLSCIPCRENPSSSLKLLQEVKFKNH